MRELARSSKLFVVAGLCEIGGGCLVRQWWRNGRAWWVTLGPEVR